MIATVTVNPSIDQHMIVSLLKKDDAVRVDRWWRDPGGKGINVSRVIRELEGESLAICTAGGCAGYMLKRLLSDQNIPFKAFDILEETRINVIVTDESDGSQTRLSVPGPRMLLVQSEEFFEKIVSIEPFPQWWILGGSLPPGVPTDFYAKLIRALNEKGAKCILDTDEEALQLGIQSSPYMIKPNEYELGRLVGSPLTDQNSIVSSALAILKKGVQVVAVTLGHRGAIVVTREASFRATTPVIEVKSKVGAGDSFIGGFMVSITQGNSFDEALRMGMAAGTAAVVNEGTALCRKADVYDLLPKIQVEKIPFIEEDISLPGLVRDPVCGMKIDPKISSVKLTYQGRDFLFCSLGCKESFKGDPEWFKTSNHIDQEKYVL